MSMVNQNASGFALEPVGAPGLWEVVAAANVLTVAESGKTFFLNSATEFATTLPPVATSQGCKFKFVVAAAPSGADYTIITTASEQTILGMQHDAGGAAGDVESSGGATTITLVGGQSVLGDTVELECDGTWWYAQIFTAVAAGATITG